MNQRAGDLRGEFIVQSIDKVSDMIRNIARVQTFASAKSRVENILDILKDLNDDFVFRQGAMPEVIDAVASLVGSDDCVGQAWQLLFESRIAGHSGLLSFSTVLFCRTCLL